MRDRIADPIVDEIRRVRAELATRHGNDATGIIRHAQEMEQAPGRTFVRHTRLGAWFRPRVPWSAGGRSRRQ